MFKSFDRINLGDLFEITKGAVCPYLFPSQEFEHHSLPSFDTSRGPATEFGRHIESHKTLLTEPVILLSKLNPRISRVTVADPSGSQRPHCCSTEFIAYKAKAEGLALRYYKYWFESDEFRSRLENSAIGTTNSHVRVNPGATLMWAIPHPTPLEQNKIAEILSTVEQAIEQMEALIDKHQRIKSGLMQDLLTRGIDEHGNLRSEQTHQFKDSPLGRIPAQWEVRRLGSLLENINQGWSPDCESDTAGQGEWGVLKTTAVVWYGYQENENKALPHALTPRKHLEIRTGDLLMTRAGPNSRVGVISFVYRTRSKLMLSDKIYRLIPNRVTDGRFLCYSLSGFQSQRHLSNLKTGMAESQTNISQDIVKALLTVCPPPPEQAVIADRLDHVSGESNQSCAAMKKLQSLKAALMQDLLTGKKRVTSMLVSAEESGAK